MEIINRRNNLPVCVQALRADGFFQRARGLMFLRAWGDMDGLLLQPCSSVHTFWMRMTIDVCFLDRKGTVLRVYPGLAPWRLAGGGRGSRDTLELPVGGLERGGVTVGDRLELRETVPS